MSQDLWTVLIFPLLAALALPLLLGVRALEVWLEHRRSRRTPAE